MVSLFLDLQVELTVAELIGPKDSASQVSLLVLAAVSARSLQIDEMVGYRV